MSYLTVGVVCDESNVELALALRNEIWGLARQERFEGLNPRTNALEEGDDYIGHRRKLLAQIRTRCERSQAGSGKRTRERALADDILWILDQIDRQD